MPRDGSDELNIRGESDAEIMLGLRYTLKYLRRDFDKFKVEWETRFDEYCREKDKCEEASEKRLARLEKFMWLIVGGLLVIEFIFKLWKA